MCAARARPLQSPYLGRQSAHTHTSGACTTSVLNVCGCRWSFSCCVNWRSLPSLRVTQLLPCSVCGHTSAQARTRCLDSSSTIAAVVTIKTHSRHTHASSSIARCSNSKASILELSLSLSEIQQAVDEQRALAEHRKADSEDSTRAAEGSRARRSPF